MTRHESAKRPAATPEDRPSQEEGRVCMTGMQALLVDRLATPRRAGMRAEQGVFWATDHAAGAIDGCKGAGPVTPAQRDETLAAIGATPNTVYRRARRDGADADTAALALTRERMARPHKGDEG